MIVSWSVSWIDNFLIVDELGIIVDLFLVVLIINDKNVDISFFKLIGIGINSVKYVIIDVVGNFGLCFFIVVVVGEC